MSNRRWIRRWSLFTNGCGYTFENLPQRGGAGQLLHDGANLVLFGSGKLPPEFGQDLDLLNRVDTKISLDGRVQSQYFDRITGARRDDPQQVCAQVTCRWNYSSGCHGLR